VRILVVAFGSRGDVAPYTGLGVRRQQAGHTVMIAAHTSFAPLVCAAGLGFHDLAGDIGVLTSPLAERVGTEDGSGAVVQAVDAAAAR
jgi:UDP:flavonoid glycosyltransferase YjiC (YdhE family)